jgi:hypothetical protein
MELENFLMMASACRNMQKCIYVFIIKLITSDGMTIHLNTISSFHK